MGLTKKNKKNKKNKTNKEYQKNKYNKTKLEPFFKKIFGEDYKLIDNNLYIDAGISVEFIPEGKAFRLDEYDGRETIKIYHPDEYFVA